MKNKGVRAEGVELKAPVQSKRREVARAE